MPADLQGAEPDVIAGLVAYLISPEAHFTTGKAAYYPNGAGSHIMLQDKQSMSMVDCTAIKQTMTVHTLWDIYN